MHTGMIIVMLDKKATAVVRDVKNIACALRRNAYAILGSGSGLSVGQADLG